MAKIDDLVHDLANKLMIADARVSRLYRLDSANHDLASLRAAVQRSVELIDEIRRQTKGVNSVNSKLANSVAAHVQFVERLSKMYNMEIAVDLESRKRGVVVDVDSDKMNQVVENILENASRAGATKMNISDKVGYETVTCRFDDNGKGCSDFGLIGTGFTTGGSGLGSQMIKRYMQEMNGLAYWQQNKSGGMSVVLQMKIKSQRGEFAGSLT